MTTTSTQAFDPGRYAQQRVEEIGVFRCAPFDWTIEDHSKPANPEKGLDATHSHALVLRFMVGKKYHTDESAWSKPWPEGFFIEVRVWIIGKEGNINDKAVKNLSECKLWNGDLDQISNERPPRVWCLVTVEQGEYQGKPQFRGNWINPDADKPAGRGQFKPLNEENMNSMRARFGSKLKASAGGRPAGGPSALPAGGAVPGQASGTASGTAPGGFSAPVETATQAEPEAPGAPAAPAASQQTSQPVADGPMPTDNPGGPIDVAEDDLPF